MPTFIVTSDWHIGAPMKGAGKAAEAFRKAKYDMVKRIGEVIARRNAQALFILGDLFDSDRIGERDMFKTGVSISKIKCPVFILPGNHDWWHQGGIMHSFDRLCQKHQNIRILLKNQAFSVDELPGITFFPSPLLVRNPVQDTSEWIPERTAEHGIRVGLLHGSLNTVPGGNIPKDVTQKRDLDFTFLGDWHKPITIDDRTYYCGSPEPGGFDESHKGQLLIVETDGKDVTVEQETVGKLAWKRIEIELESTEVGGLGLQKLKQELDENSSIKELTALRLHLSGSLSWDELTELDDHLARLPFEGWAAIDTENIKVRKQTEINLDSFPEALKVVAQGIIDSAATDIVKRKALTILNSKQEAIQ